MNALAATEAERAAIAATATDYIQSWLDGDRERMRRCLHPELAKRTVEEDPSTGRPHVRTTTFDQLVQWTGDGRGTANEPGFEVEIFDAHAGIASVAVRSVPYVDYLHIARVGDQWLIVNALWQPRADKSPPG